MKHEIRIAYERMNPPREAKERMMKNIMKKQNRQERFYSATPTPQRWWTAIPAALVLICVLVIGWQVLIPNENPVPIATNPGETTGPTEYVGLDILKLDELFQDVPEQYLHIVGNYYSGLQDDVDSVAWEKLGLNPAAFENLDVIEGLGYVLIDLDENGKEELLITDGDQIYDLYVEIEGEIQELLSNRIHYQGKRNSVKLCEGNVILIWQVSSGDDYTHWYRLGKDGLGTTALVCEEMVLLDDYSKWYAGPNDKDAVEVSEEEAREILNSRDPVFVNYTPICPEKFAGNSDVMPAGYAHILEKYVKAHTEEWTPEEYMQNDISYVLASKNIYWEYGYALIDLNGDGIDELIITDGERIYDAYILMEDGGAGHIISAGERTRYFLCKDYVIGYQGSSGAGNSCWEYSRLMPGGDSEIVMYLQFDTDAYYKMEGGSDQMVAISHDEADEIIADYWHIKIPFQTILPAEQEKELKYPRTYVQMLREMMSEYSGIATMHVAFTDVTGDGHDEMLLGFRGNDSFGHVYSVMYGGVTEILCYGSDIDFTLCKGGMICHHQADKPFGNYTFISLKGGVYQIIEHLVYDTEIKSWVWEKDGIREFITDAEKQEILDSYGSVSLEWISVLEAIAG